MSTNSRHEIILSSGITVAAIAGAAATVHFIYVYMYWSRLRLRQQQTQQATTTSKTTKRKKVLIVAPPYVKYTMPFLGSASDFSKDCKAFVKKHSEALDSPIFSALIAGKTYHFITSAEYPVEHIFRQKQLSFQPIAYDALKNAFGVTKAGAVFASEDPSKLFGSIYHKHLLAKEGLGKITFKSQIAIKNLISNHLCISDGAVCEVLPLYEVVQKIIFCATMSSVFSQDMATTDNLKSHNSFDDKFPLLIGGMPAWLFPTARGARESLLDGLRQPDHKNRQSSFLKVRYVMKNETFIIINMICCFVGA